MTQDDHDRELRKLNLRYRLTREAEVGLKKFRDQFAGQHSVDGPRIDAAMARALMDEYKLIFGAYLELSVEWGIEHEGE